MVFRTQKLHINLGLVQVALKFVTFSLFQLLKLIVTNFLGNISEYFLIQIIETDSAGVYYFCKVIDEELLPDSLVDPSDLQEKARN